MTAVLVAVAILYGLAAGPLFVFCVGASGHREVEFATCTGCAHPSGPDVTDPAKRSSVAGGFRPAESCSDCVDFSLTLAATGQEDPDKSPGTPDTSSSCPCPPAGLAVPAPLAASADHSGIQEPAFPAIALPLPLRI